MAYLYKWNYTFTSLALIFVVAFLYAITGFLGLYLAPPPGYATAIWVPSGIALGATLVWGLRILPGVFLGSLIINFYISTRIAIPYSLLMPAIIGCAIATGATLQTWVGWELIKKWLGLHNPLHHMHDILLFAILSGPVSALINSTWSNTALLLLDILPLYRYSLSWIVWWMGDSIGILIFTPVFLILFAFPRYIWGIRIVPILLPLFGGFIAVILAYFAIESNELANIKTSFSNTMNNDLMHLQNLLLTEKIRPLNPKVPLDQLMNQSFKNKNNYYLIKIDDVTFPGYIKTIYTFIHPRLKPPVGFFNIEFQNVIDIAEQRWLISAKPSVVYINERITWQSSLLLMSGLLFCVLLNIILFIINGQKYLAQLAIKEKTDELKSAEHKNLQILEAVGEGIYGINLEGYTTFINPAGANMLGYDAKEIIGKKIHDLIHYKRSDGASYPTENCPIYAAAHQNKVYRVSDEVFWRKDGSSFWVDYTSTPLKDGEKLMGAVVVFKDISQQRQIEFKLERMAHYDTLTSLPNRSSFLNHLAVIVEHAKLTKRPLAVLFIDIDNFKQINDNLGHNTGDQTLKLFADLLRNDLNKVGYFARLGGDEFGAILEYINSEKDIHDVLDEITRILKQPIKIGELEIKLNVSIGVATFPYAGVNAEDLITNADIAMYHVKESGKGIFAFYDKEISKQIKRRNQIDMQLRHALNREEFSLYYQLQIDSNTLKPYGIETLVRWQNKELGNVSPSEFIPIAEVSGVIDEIGKWVLKKAFLDYSKLVQFYKEVLILSINVSVVQLDNTNFFNTMKKIMNETSMAGKNILLEITETSFMRNPGHTLTIMNKILALDIQFALDDFDISYSSMQYLKNMPVSHIKLDQSFVKDMVKDTSDAKIIDATIQLAHALGMCIIAEGVENKEQFDMLKTMGCEYMQGYYFAKPMSLRELIEYLTEIKI